MFRICPKCSTQNEDSAAFCDYCGASLMQLVPPLASMARPAPLPQFAPAPAPGVRSILVCGVCGQEAQPGDVYCINCGNPVASSPPMPSAPPPGSPSPLPSAPPKAGPPLEASVPPPQPAAASYLSPATPIPPQAPSAATSLVSDASPPAAPVPGAATRVFSTGRLVIGDVEIPLPQQPEVTLGRQDPYSKPPWHPGVDLTAYGAGDPAYGVSRKHAKILWAGDWTIEDQHSANGTFVGGQRISQRTPLKDKDQIMLGRLVMTFRAD